MSINRRRFLIASFAAAAAWQTGARSRMWAALPASENDVVRKSRQAALAVLAPSDRDVRHGLELHAASLVFDSYGFAPRAALGGTAFRETMLAGASDSELIDLREDMNMTRAAHDEIERREFLEAFHESGVTCIFQNCGEEGNDPLRLLKRLSRFTFLTDSLAPVCSKAISPEAVSAAKKAGQVCLAFTTNGVPLSQTWESTREGLRYVKLFRQLGVQMMHLTYNRRNPLGDGSGEAVDGGLSDFGRIAIAELNRLGIIVDTARRPHRHGTDLCRWPAPCRWDSERSCRNVQNVVTHSTGRETDQRGVSGMLFGLAMTVPPGARGVPAVGNKDSGRFDRRADQR